MKNKKGLGIGIALIAIMLIVCIVLVVMMMTGGQKETYYGYMKNDHTIDKMVNEQTEKIEKMLNCLLIAKLMLRKATSYF